AVSDTSSATLGARGQGRGLGESAGGAGSITNNAALSSRVQTLLPSGESISSAAAGFENQGQFIAAAHAAHNLNIPFDQLKAQMTGKDQTSLGKAIQKLRPDLDGKDVKENVKLAGQQSSRDVAQASAKGSSRVATSIASDSKLAARLTALLPPGTTLTQAAAGFRNQGQFIAALEASKNLGIPFADLQDRMTAGESLGAAIHGLKPAMTEADVSTSVKAAEEQAKTVQVDASVNTSASASASAK
ncbi:MAG TPA: hypothetical protein VN579_03835, partial [Bryobacteraceae bacterium]|nr:hypothetical protein [Bryobacteraceae bacterium]